MVNRRSGVGGFPDSEFDDQLLDDVWDFFGDAEQGNVEVAEKAAQFEVILETLETWLLYHQNVLADARFTAKHLAGKHDQMTHAGGRGVTARSSGGDDGGIAETEAMLKAAKKAVSDKMKLAKETGDYSGMSQLRRVVKGLEADLETKKKLAAKGGSSVDVAVEAKAKKAIKGGKKAEVEKTAAELEAEERKHLDIDGRDEIVDEMMAAGRASNYSKEAFREDLLRYGLTSEEMESGRDFLVNALTNNPKSYTTRERAHLADAIDVYNQEIAKARGISIEEAKTGKVKVDPKDLESGLAALRQEYDDVSLKMKDRGLKPQEWERLAKRKGQLKELIDDSPITQKARENAQAVAGEMMSVIKDRKKEIDRLETLHVDAVARGGEYSTRAVQIKVALGEQRIKLRGEILEMASLVPGDTTVGVSAFTNKAEKYRNYAKRREGEELVNATMKRPELANHRYGVDRIGEFGRAHANAQTVNLTDTNNPGVWAHEIAHTMEYASPSLARDVSKFYDRRTKNSPKVTMRSLTGKNNYEADEVTRPDDFIDAYTGKDYGRTAGVQRATEITSMFYSTLWESPDKFANDEDFFNEMAYILGWGG